MRTKAFIVVVVVALLIPASASAWTSNVSVGDQPVAWQSPQVFRSDDFLRLRVFSAGRELQADQSNDCVSYLYGNGIAVRADSCGRHLQLRIASSRSKPTHLRIHYYRV